MAWTSPITWSVGGIISAANMNAQLRDNMSYLLSGRPSSWVNFQGVASYGIPTTQTTFTDIDNTNLIINITPNSSRILLLFSIGFNQAFHATTITQLDIIKNSTTRLGNATNGLWSSLTGTNPNFGNPATIFAFATGLTPGVAVTFKPQCRLSASTGTTLNLFTPGNFFALEV